MAPPPSHPSGISPKDQGITVELLQSVQAYLRSLADLQTPEPHLVEDWRRFCGLCEELIQGFAFVRRLPEDDQKDCVQELWIKLFTILPNFSFDPERGPFRAWLRTVVRHHVADFCRDKRRRPLLQLDFDPSAVLYCRDGNPVAALEGKWRHEAVWRALERLRQRVPERNFQVLFLRWIEECPRAEVARKLSLTLSRVSFIEHRMRRKLRDLLDVDLPSIN